MGKIMSWEELEAIDLEAGCDINTGCDGWCHIHGSPAAHCIHRTIIAAQAAHTEAWMREQWVEQYITEELLAANQDGQEFAWTEREARYAPLVEAATAEVNACKYCVAQREGTGSCFTAEHIALKTALEVEHGNTG